MLSDYSHWQYVVAKSEGLKSAVAAAAAAMAELAVAAATVW